MASSPSTSAAASGRQTRQKRVNPSRSSKGCPGIGNCEADTLILETQRRQLENGPLIPANTLFFMTTSLELLPKNSSSSNGQPMFNIYANERYFERPEVMESYRLQQSIETPDFTELSQTHVGGRFRPRGSDDAMEKRQRLREKEQLKYEQYKLKERTEQLRGMDAMAFLTLPAESFTPKPSEEEDTELPSISASGFHINNPSLYKEGERRRREMLNTATTLEERYRILLPPDKKSYPKKCNEESVEIRISEEVVSEWEENEVEGVENQHETEGADVFLPEEDLYNEKPVTLTIKVPPRVASTAPTPAPTPPAMPASSTKAKTEVKSVSPTNQPQPFKAAVPVKSSPPLPKKRKKPDFTPSTPAGSPPPLRPTWSGTRPSPFLPSPPPPVVTLSTRPIAGSSSLSPVSIAGPDELPGSPVSPLFDEPISVTPTLSNPEIATLDISIKSVSSPASDIDFIVDKSEEEPEVHTTTTGTGMRPRKRLRHSYTYSATQSLIKESVSAPPLPRPASFTSVPKSKAPGFLLSAALKRNQNNPRGTIVRHYVAWGVKLGPDRKGEEKEYEIPREIREESLVAAVMAKIEDQCPDVDEPPPEPVEVAGRRKTHP
ncbi:hypothetical protein IW261DRAFT_1472252 [Armillaria novae-zelandiae]|uniref:PEHE domain-containing protein n=1 Tax=Armillaria novae-zelandiae TaxID=153914 RepID=A0AA39PCM6_9AGAR|nr:hypothetical protein IW261DRAFT_1472252 [Armillaria novae-zelandiae]